MQALIFFSFSRFSNIRCNSYFFGFSRLFFFSRPISICAFFQTTLIFAECNLFELWRASLICVSRLFFFSAGIFACSSFSRFYFLQVFYLVPIFARLSLFVLLFAEVFFLAIFVGFCSSCCYSIHCWFVVHF